MTFSPLKNTILLKAIIFFPIQNKIWYSSLNNIFYWVFDFIAPHCLRVIAQTKGGGEMNRLFEQFIFNKINKKPT